MELEPRFLEYTAQFGKQYGSEEEWALRLKTFTEKDEFIRQHNSDPKSTAKLGHNKFSDMTQSEINAWLGVKHQLLQQHS